VNIVKKGSQGHRSKVKVVNIIFSELYDYNLYSYSLEGAISCVQMCACYTGGDIHYGCLSSRL